MYADTQMSHSRLIYWLPACSQSSEQICRERRTLENAPYVEVMRTVEVNQPFHIDSYVCAGVLAQGRLANERVQLLNPPLLYISNRTLVSEL